MGSPQISFQVRAEGYATLTIEALQSLQQQDQVQAPLPPPFVQPVLDAGSSAQSVPPGPVAAQPPAGTAPGNTGRFSKPWLVWLWNMWRYITQGNDQLSILAPSVDETDIGWYATGSINATDDPATFTATLVGLQRPQTGQADGTGPQVTITNGGSGYSSGAVITVASSNGQGQPALFAAVVTGGVVTGATQTTQGYNLAAPLVVTIAGGGTFAATAILGRQFAIGDYVIWNDPTIPSGKNEYQYEIDQITDITPGGDSGFTCSLVRAGAGSASGQAQYGSLLAAHGAGTALYRLINKEFFANLDIQAGPQVLKFLWDNMTVAAVELNGAGLMNPSLINLAPLPFLSDGVTNNTRSLPACPGLRTMSGAAYTNLGISGVLSLGATAQARVSAQAWESIRTIYAKVRTAPTGATTFNGDANACVVIYVCYIPLGATAMSNVGLIDTLVIDTGLFNSFALTNPPDGRQMPYHAYFPFIAPYADWPPNVLPALAGALNSSLTLQLGWTYPSATIQYAPDGDIDFIVAQVGSTIPGSNLIVTAQV